MQLEQRLAPNSYLTLKCKIVFFEKCHIQVFFQLCYLKYQFEEQMGLFKCKNLQKI